MRSCSDECRKHPRNRYFVEQNMTVEEYDQRLQEIEKHRNDVHAN